MIDLSKLKKAAEAYAVALRIVDVDQQDIVSEPTLEELSEHFQMACAETFGAHYRLSGALGGVAAD